MGQKLVFFVRDRKSILVPFWEELSVDKTWDNACTIKDFSKYMPDEWNCAKKVERKFFWDVLSTLSYEYVDQLIEECRELRNSARDKKMIKVKNTINITHDWATLFLAGSFKSSKFQPKFLPLFI